MGKRYVKIFKNKSRKFNIKHMQKGYSSRYRKECRKAYRHLVQTGGVQSNNSLKRKHQPMHSRHVAIKS